MDMQHAERMLRVNALAIRFAKAGVPDPMGAAGWILDQFGEDERALRALGAALLLGSGERVRFAERP